MTSPRKVLQYTSLFATRQPLVAVTGTEEVEISEDVDFVEAIGIDKDTPGRLIEVAELAPAKAGYVFTYSNYINFTCDDCRRRADG